MLSLDYTGMHQSETCRMHGGCEQCPEKQHEMICDHEDDSRGASMLFDNQVQELIQVNISISDGHPRHEIILQPANPAEEFFQHSEGLNLAIHECFMSSAGPSSSNVPQPIR